MQPHSTPHSLALTHSFTHSLTPSLTHSLLHSLTHSLSSCRPSYPELAAELVREVAECSKYKESKTYLAALLKVLLALPLDPTQHPAPIKTLVGEPPPACSHAVRHLLLQYLCPYEAAVQQYVTAGVMPMLLYLE